MPSSSLQHDFPSKKINIVIFTLLGLFTLIGMGVDLIAPSLPTIAHDLHTSDAFSKNLITIFLFGVIAGNLLMVLLSDSFGRRSLLLGALVVFIISSLLPTLFPDIYNLIISRFLQGASIALFSTMVRATFSDLLSHERLMKVVPLTATMWGIGPIIGPIIGGYLQFYFGWHACFYFYAGFACIGLIILLLTLPETHFQRHPLNIKQLVENYSEIFANRVFIGMIVTMGLTYSLLIVFNNIGPFLIQNRLGFSPIAFGKIALCCGVIFLFGTLLSKQLLKLFLPIKLIKILLPIGLCIALVALILTSFYEKNILIIVITTFGMFLICGILYPSSLTVATTLFRHLAASASAIMSLVNISITCTVSWIMSFLSDASSIPLICTYGLLMALGMLVFNITLHNERTC